MDVYKQFFRSYPVSQLDASESKRQAANFGGKIYLPASALGRLTMIRISYPMLFELRAGKSSSNPRTTYAGVLEFIAPEGRVYLPDWMMIALKLKPGALLEVRSTSLELGRFVKIEPQSADFLEISDPKAVLENSLRNFSALHVNDVFQISYNSQTYGIKVLDVKPETDKQAICCVETDLEVDFAPPVGYEEEQAAKRARVGSNPPNSAAQPTSGLGGIGASLSTGNTALSKAYVEQVQSQSRQAAQGIRLSGKEVKVDVSPVDSSIYSNRDAPALELPQGQLFFGFPVVPVAAEESKTEDPFGSSGGRALRDKDKRKR